jgi:hypothetical protein
LARRVSLPTADDLFRPTVVPGEAPAPKGEPTQADSSKHGTSGAGESGAGTTASVDAEPQAKTERKPSGRVRHDEKMTVYVTADELLDLEHARLVLRRSHGLAVDRGRLVREAVAIALADLEVNGDESLLVQRLTQP